MKLDTEFIYVFVEIIPQNLDLSYAIVDVFFGVSILEFIICLLLFYFFITHRNHSHIRRNSYLVSLVILVGVTSSVIGLFFQSFARTDALCWITFYFLRAGLVFVTTGLFAKNYRIYTIFSNRGASAVNLSEEKLLIWIGTFSVIYLSFPTVIFLTVGYDAVTLQSTSNIYYKYVQCRIPNNTWDDICQFTIDIVLLIIIFASIILAWLTRSVSKEYRESHPLAAFSVIILAISLVLIPLGKTLDDETDSELFRYVISAEFNTVIIFSALGLLFIPKVFTILKGKSRDSLILDE